MKNSFSKQNSCWSVRHIYFKRVNCDEVPLKKISKYLFKVEIYIAFFFSKLISILSSWSKLQDNFKNHKNSWFGYTVKKNHLFYHKNSWINEEAH